MTNINAPAFQIQSSLWPTDGQPKSLRAVLDFTGSTDIAFDLFFEIMDGVTESIQGVFVDNADSATALTLNFSINQHRLVIPAGSQGTFPILAGVSCQGTAHSAGGVAIPLHFLNVPTPWNIWGPVTINTGGGGGSLPVNPLQSAAFTNRSALTNAGASKQLMAANAARKAFYIANPPTNLESVWICFGAAATGDYQSWEITPGGNFPSNGVVSPQAVNVFSVNAVGVNAWEA